MDSGFKKFLRTSLCFLTFSVVVFFQNITDVHALSIGGEEFDRFLSIGVTDGDGSLGRFGHWLHLDKVYTYSVVASPSAINIDEVNFVDADFANYDFDKFFAMAVTEHYTHKVGPPFEFKSVIKDGNLELRGSNGELLLSAVYDSVGTVITNPYIGPAGQSNVVGLFDVTGGLLQTAGLLGSSIYLDMAFRTGVAWAKGDFHATLGTINFYTQASTSNNAIPEPATVTLLGASLIGGIMRRRKVKI